MYHQEELIDIKDELFEETRTQLLRTTWLSIKARVGKQNIVAHYVGIKKNGDIIFSTNSGTKPGQKWSCIVRFENFDKAQELYKTKRFFRKRAVTKMLLDGDIKVFCNCHCWKYYFKHTAWRFGYGIKVETTPARIRNPHNEKSLCKHLVASLLLLESCIGDVYKDMTSKKYLTESKGGVV